MAVRKRVTTRTTKKPHKPSVSTTPTNGALFLFVVIIAFVVFGLAMLWRQLPTRPSRVVQVAPVTTALQVQRLTCERAGGKWTDCGNSCHGKDKDSCQVACEAQCLCGGAPQYTCPVNMICADKTSESDAVGVCREQAEESSTIVAVEDVRIEAVVDASTYPFNVRGTVSGTSTALWWTAVDESSEVIGRGVIRWPMTTSSAFEDSVFLAKMPTSTALRFIFTAGSPTDKIEAVATSTKLTGMTRTIYKDDPAAEACDVLIKEEIVLPKTVLPYEATMRAALGDSLIDLSVSQGIATIVIPPAMIYSDSCANARIEAIAKAVTKDFTTVTDLVIQAYNTQP